MNFPDRMRKATPSIRWTKAVESNPPVLGATFSSGKTEAGFEAKAAPNPWTRRLRPDRDDSFVNRRRGPVSRSFRSPSVEMTEEI